MEEIYAKFVSQKISKTRWRPLPPGSLQTAETFATGSWDNETLSVSQQWTAAHYHTGPGSPSCSNAPCTGVVCNNPEIVTVGEDGRINLFRADHKEAVRTIDNADSSTLHAVTFLRTPEILTVNSIGQLKIWDFRQQGNEPTQILSLTGDRVPLHCVDRHPNQQHVVATGGQDGMLSIWDVRQGTMPVSLLKAHEAERGRNSTFLSHSISNQANVHQSLISSWLSTDPAKDRIEITSLLPNRTLSVNSLDVLGPCLVCGTDAEAIYVTRQLFS
ncbi:hypothetical protein G4228_016660 [Cervus hanglu yarkandensis]|nr:hypothetical protein G4228_016660 [Cervus hanglu yarkandensis]